MIFDPIIPHFALLVKEKETFPFAIDNAFAKCYNGSRKTESEVRQVKKAGIICECNPFHKGHEYLFHTAKESGADLVICLLSGYFTQRGEPAIFDPYTRAETMLRGGADLVLELPFPYSAASAEFFASAGVDLFSKIGIDELWFGSESKDLSRLARLAKVADDPEFLAAYEKSVKSASGSAKTYFELLQSFAEDQGEVLPNDILAVQYLRAMNRLAAPFVPKTVRRMGNAHDEKGLADFSSASALRDAILKGELWHLGAYLPSGSLPLLQKAVDEGLAPSEWKKAESALLWHLRAMKEEEISQIAGLSGGLGERIQKAANQANSLDELFALAATKKYPLARIRRGILFAMTGVREQDLRTPASYLRLLGANEAGRSYLAALRKNTSIPIVTKQKDLPRGSRQEALESAALSLYGLCLPSQKTVSFFLGLPPRVEK